MNVIHVTVINSADKSTGDNTKIKLIKTNKFNNRIIIIIEKQ